MTSNELRDHFEKYGKVRDVYLPMDFYTKYVFHVPGLFRFKRVISFHQRRQRRGYGFVEFFNHDDAMDAKDALDRSILDGREVGSRPSPCVSHLFFFFKVTVVCAQEKRKTPGEMRRRDE